jgi:hypothetical protein
MKERWHWQNEAEREPKTEVAGEGEAVPAKQDVCKVI